MVFMFLKKSISIIVLLVWWWISLLSSTMYAQGNGICSTTQRWTANSQTYKIMYSINDSLLNQYLTLIDVDMNTTVLWAQNWNDNQKWWCNNGSFTDDELSKRDAWWTTNNRLQWAGASNGSSLSLVDVTKMQGYINDNCGFTIKVDWKLGKKTVNAVQLCDLPCEWKCKRSDFTRFKDKLYYDEAGTKKVYENNKFNDGNPRQKLYIHESDLASANLSKDTLSTQWLWLTKNSFDVCTDPSDKTKKLLTTPEYTAVSSYVTKKSDNSCEIVRPSVATDQVWPPKPDDNIKADQTTAAAAKLPNSPDVKSRLNKLPLASASSTTPSEAWCTLQADSKYAAYKDNDGQLYSFYKDNVWLTADGKPNCSCTAWSKNVTKVFSNNWSDPQSLSVCEKCDKEKCNCGIKLNTNVPFIGRCIMYGDTNETNDPSYTQWDSDTIIVNSLNAFPVLMGGLIKILMSVILLLCFGSLIVAGVMMTIPGYYDTGKWLIKKVVVAIALLGASGTILYLINPNFFF